MGTDTGTGWSLQILVRNHEPRHKFVFYFIQLGNLFLPQFENVFKQLCMLRFFPENFQGLSLFALSRIRSKNVSNILSVQGDRKRPNGLKLNEGAAIVIGTDWVDF
jgi:hypothetical protein